MHTTLITLRTFLLFLSGLRSNCISACCKPIMSGAGTRNKGKTLIQSKLSFTSTLQPNAKGKLPEATLSTDEKGIKRKFEQLAANDKMDDDKRQKILRAAEKRQEKTKPDSSIESSHVEGSDQEKVDNLGDKKQKMTQTDKKSSTEPSHMEGSDEKEGLSESKPTAGDEADEPQASTSAGGEGQQAGDTQQYDMSGSGSQDDCPSDSMDNMSDSLDEDSCPCPKPKTGKSSCTWKGKPSADLKIAPGCLPHDLKLEYSDNHTVCIRMPFTYSETSLPQPYPRTYRDRWDGDHVYMPCSDRNEYPMDNGIFKRWDLIKRALKEKINGPFELEEAILSYNQRYANKWNFTALHHFFTKHLRKEERDEFFDSVLPFMVNLALKLPHLCTEPIPLLKKGKPRKLTLSQQQIGCLLANAFFCTFPRRNSRSRSAEFSSYPDINFNNLFQGQPVSRKMEKLRCIIHYFKRLESDMPKGIVTFSRQTLGSFDWYACLDSLRELHVSSAGTIEDNGTGMLQVDFANKYLGGGVLGHGCVQEEIRFMICPEMIITRLFTEMLEDKDSLVMTGCERFSDYEGYADGFKWKGDHKDETARDSLGRLCCEVVAIDALVFRNDYNRQFKKQSVLRELNKAYCGFMSKARETNRAAVCTGNWGCGAFGGDKQLKALLQLMAASVAKRDVCYFTFGDEKLTADLDKVHSLLRREDRSIKEVMWLIDDYNRKIVSGTYRKPSTGLFEFIHATLEGHLDSQDSQFQSSSSAAFDENSNEGSVSDSSPDRGSPNYKAETP